MIEVQFDSKTSFSRVTRFLLTFFPKMRRRLFDLAEEVMRETERDLKEAIRNKDRSSFIKRLRRIHPAWVDQKRAKGWKLHQLAAAEHYVDGIIFDRSNDRMSLKMRNGMYPGRNITYGDLARFLEYGTKNMKPLPHWRKASRHFKDSFKRRAEEEFKHVRVRN